MNNLNVFFRFCVGDRFFLCDNKILCEYDYEERMVFANLAYNSSNLAHIKQQAARSVAGKVSLGILFIQLDHLCKHKIKSIFLCFYIEVPHTISLSLNIPTIRKYKMLLDTKFAACKLFDHINMVLAIVYRS